jgi:hypothetical protein
VAQAQEVVGDWIGTLETGMSDLRIVLHVTKSDDGTLKATMDSPDQGVAGLVVDSITLENSKLKFAVTVIKASYEGKVKNANSITGNWTQVPKKGALDFKKTTTPPKLDHPPASPSDIDGAWEGTLDMPQAKLRLVFHVKNTGDGLTATMDSPDQNLKGWPATSVNRKGSSIKIEMHQIEGLYEGEINKDLTIIRGDWTQGSHFPLTLRRAKEQPPDLPKQNPAPAQN